MSTDAPDYLSRIRTGTYLDQQRFAPLAWAVHGIVPEGFGLLTGPPKAGKSWLALALALGVASGGVALGKIPTGNARPVLLLALEDGERRLQDRCRTLLLGEPIPERLHYVTAATPGDVVPLIRAWLQMHGHLSPLVVVDTLGKVMPQALPGEGAYQRDYRIGGTLHRLAGECPGTTLLVVHHVRKASGEDWMDSTSGTNGLNGAADFTVNLSRARNEDAGVLRVTGRDVAEGEYAVTHRGGSWEIDGHALADAARKATELRAASGLGDQSAEVVRVVGEHPEGIGPAAVGRALDVSTERAGQMLTRLHAAGRIGKAGRGLYTPLDPLESVESLESSAPANSPNSPLSTPLPREDCSVCGEALAAVLVADGEDVHPLCAEGVAS